MGGGVEIEEGEVLVLTPDIEKGCLEIKIIDGSGETVFDETESGQGSSTHELEPGDYSMSVTVNENDTTGTLVVAPTRAASE